jgi:LuxR family transcriptional regulator, maltose regulon positive regulatory protein
MATTPLPVRRTGERGRDRPAPSFAILESKLAPGSPRPGSVARSRLVDRLLRSSAPVVAVIAPAGYGKTTVLRQWDDQDDRPFAWISLDEADNDPAVLASYLAAALDRIQPVDARVFRALRAQAAIRSVVVPRLGAALWAAPPFVLIVDGVHVLREQECHAVLTSLAHQLPEGAQIVLAGRSVAGIPLGRLRAHGQLEELGADELALDERETELLLAAAGVHATATELAEVKQSTEGWPAGVYFAALSIEAANGQRGAGGAFSGDDRVVRDYLALELLSKLSAAELRFVLRTAALDEMCGELCDAVLGETGSANMIDTLEQASLFVVPLDRDRRWYRYHRLCHQMLRSELERREPGAARDLQRKAAAWCEAHDRPEAALAYAEAAGDEDHVAALVAKLIMPLYSSGHSATVERWLKRLDGEILREHPALSVFGAFVHAFGGRPLEATRWAGVAESGVSARPLPDGGSSIEPWTALLRAVMCAHGVPRMREDAESALAGLTPDSMWRGTALLVLGVAHSLAGDETEAELVLADAAEIAVGAGATGTTCVILAERALLALGHGDIDSAEALLQIARATVREARLEGYATTALVHAASARCALRRGDPGAAGDYLARASGLRPLLTYALPWLSVQARLELARVYIGLADPGSARTLMAEVGAIRRRRPDLGVLGEQAAALSAQVASLRGAKVEWASTLTRAELRLLPLLTTHLSFREIGERLFVSRNTVKTEAISVYRKLGVRSRSAAIERAAELGLLDESTLRATHAAARTS